MNTLYHLRFALATSVLILSACADPIEAALPPDELSPGSPIFDVNVQEHETIAQAPPTMHTIAKPNNTAPRTAPKPQQQIQRAEPALPAKYKLSGEQPFFDVKRCINVGNALEAEKEGDWGYKIREEDLSAIADAGFDTVRIPVRWDTHMQDYPPYAVSGLYFIRIKQVINQARRLGLGVILDVHHYEGIIENTDAEEARFLSLWEQIATTFADEPKNLYFEILNEPTNAMSMTRLNKLYSKVIPIIRKSNPTRILIIGGNSWNAVDTMGKIAWPNDKNLVATFHDYGPHEFTHQGAPWTDNQWPVGRKWGGKADYNELTDAYKIAARFQAKRNVPILVGEFGVIDTVSINERTQWIKARRQQMESAGYSWCAWDLAGAFKIYDTENRVWLPGVLDALMGD